MPPRGMSGERPAASVLRAPQFKSAEEELAYLRERVKSQDAVLNTSDSRAETDRIAKKEVALYGETSPRDMLHPDVVLAEHETIRLGLKLEPEEHDGQLDGLLKLVEERGIRNALSVVAKLKNPHIEDDFHRALVRYIAEGLPQKGMAPPEAVRKSLETVLFQIEPQAHGEGSKESQQQAKLEQILSSSEQLYAGLSSFVSGNEGFSLEIAVPQGTEEATLYLGVPRSKQTLAERLMSSIFPNARISESRGDYNVFNYEGEHAAAYATLANPAPLPLKTAEMFERDPMNLLLASFAKIKKHGEGAALQIIVGNEGERYNKHYKKMMRQLEKGKSFGEAVHTPETMLGDIAKDFGNAIFYPTDPNKQQNQSMKSTDQVATEEIGRKIKSRIAPVVIRLITSAPQHARADEMLDNLITPFAQYDDSRGNHLVFKKLGWWGSAGFLRDFTYRSFDTSRIMPLSLAEVATIFHFTAERVNTSRELKKSYAKQTPAPVDMSVNGIILGANRYGATETLARFGEADRLRHCYVIGQTGTGKTNLLKNMIMQDMQNGDGVAYIDPHGSDIEDVLASVPPERMKDVIYFDPAGSIDRPMGLNMLEYDESRPEMKTFVVDEVYGIFRKLYSDVPDAFGPMFEQYYRNATQLVVEDPSSGSTILEIGRVLSDKRFRDMKIAKCKNPVIVNFWRKIAEASGGEASLENIVPYITSKTDVFTANDIMRPIIAQQKSSFDFREIMDSKKIFLANLAKGRLGERNTSLLGLILVSKFTQAAFSRVDSRDALNPFYLYIDEFQNFATPSISTILSEARKYKLSLTIAHQFIAQLDEKIRDAVIGNVGTKAAFRIGTTDADFLEKQFLPTFTATDLENLPNYHAVLSMLANNVPAKPFTITPLPPPPRDYSKIDAMKEFSYSRYGRLREEVEAEIAARYAPPVREPELSTFNPFNSYV